MEKVQSLWIGPRLSKMEQLCLYSFLCHKVPFDLYCYDHVEGIPEGINVLDANDIVPKKEIFYYEGGRVSAFSNYFRYQMLLKKGGCWVDMDMVLINPTLFSEEYVFSSEQHGKVQKTNVGFIKAPKGNRLMRLVTKGCDQMRRNPTPLKWGSYGPKLFQKFVGRMKYQKYVKEAEYFCPIHYDQMDLILEKQEEEVKLPEKTVMIHLWNEFWHRRELDKDKIYSNETLLGRLQELYLPAEIRG